jgi:lipoprotein-anchoring transpeptidase ErfK/SrfK
MRTFLIGAALAYVLAAGPAMAEVSVAIDLATQHMHVESASGTYDWPVSTAREGYVTPTGTFKPERLMEVYHSKKYDNAPMPHAVFFYYGFAIHGTYETKHLGHPASHGCVRLAPQNAAKLFTMVKAEGATITITGTPPGQTGYAVASATPTKSSGLLSFLGF